MKKYLPFIFIILLSLCFSWKFFFQGLLPIPADTLVGLYHPFRDYYSQSYPNGIPFKNFLITDPIRQQYPWRELAMQDIKSGGVPSWNPYSFSGTPLAANYQSAAFYPLNVLLVLVPFSIGWSFLVILQPMLSGIFMYLYLRKMRLSIFGSVIGSIVYSFSGFNMVWFTWNTLGHVVLWLPLILYCKEKLLNFLLEKKIKYKELFLFGLILVFAEAMYIFAGHIQMAFYVFCVSNLYLAARTYQIGKTLVGNKIKEFLFRTSIFFTISAFIIALITSIQIVPFIEFVFMSGRTVDQNIVKEGWFIPFKHLIQFVAPDFFGNPATLNYWGTWNYAELVGYIGVVPLLFVFTCLFYLKRRMILFFMLLAGLALVFSTENIFAKLPFIFNIPLISTSQPTRLLFVVDFSFAVLSALGFDLIYRHRLSGKKIALLACSFILVYGIIWMFVYLNIFSQDAINVATSKRNLVIPTLLMIAGIFYLLLPPKFSIKYGSFVSMLIIFIIAADLLRFGWKFTPFVSAEYLYPKTVAIEFIINQPGIFRVMSLDSRILPPNVTTPYKIQTIDGYDPLYIKNYGELATSIVRNRPDISPFSFNRMITIQQPDNKLIDFMNVRYVFSLTEIDSQKLEKVFDEGQTKIYENMSVFPRAFLVNNIKKASDKQEAINFLYDPGTDLHKTAIVYDDIAVSTEKLSDSEQVEIMRYENSSVELSVKADQTRLLVLSDVYYPKWRAYIDNVETPIYEVNYAFRGVVIPAGSHTVVFKYL